MDRKLEEKYFRWRPVQASGGMMTMELMEGMRDAEESFHLDLLRDRAIHVMRSAVLTFDLPGHKVERDHRVTFEEPASPWQHWKRAHANSWWLRRFVARYPVRTVELSETIHFSAEWQEYVTYPWQKAAPTSPHLGAANRLVHLLVMVDGEESPETPEAPAEA